MPTARARVGALALLLSLASALPAAAADTIVVDTGRDLPDATPGDSDCDVAVGENAQCSLRAAVQTANVTPEPDTIQLTGITYELTLSGAGEDDSATGDLDVTTPIEITSDQNFATTVIDAKKLKDRIFDVKPGGSLTLSKMTLENGKTAKDDFDPGAPGEVSGGCLRSEGDVALSGVFFFSCGSTDDGGCMSVLDGDATIFGTIFSTCRAKNEGGGIELGALGSAALDRVTLFSGKAGTGGGIAASGPLTLKNVTITGNKAKVGGGLATLGSAATTLNNATLASNGASNLTRQGTGTVTVSNSVLALAKNDCVGAIVSAGGNVVDDASCSLGAANDQPDTDPQLLPLNFYPVLIIPGPGGNAPVPDPSPDVPTMALSQDSPAIDQALDGSCEETDARGQVRDDVVDVGVAECDSGSFEFFQP
jgi:hypothetical protein